MMKNTSMTQSQSQIFSITFSHQKVQSKIKFSNKYFRNFLSTKNNDSFIITATNKEEICKVISSLNINKSCEPNSIPNKILHLVQDQISKHLATVPNLIFLYRDISHYFEESRSNSHL